MNAPASKTRKAFCVVLTWIIPASADAGVVVERFTSAAVRVLVVTPDGGGGDVDFSPDFAKSTVSINGNNGSATATGEARARNYENQLWAFGGGVAQATAAPLAYSSAFFEAFSTSRVVIQADSPITLHIAYAVKDPTSGGPVLNSYVSTIAGNLTGNGRVTLENITSTGIAAILQKQAGVETREPFQSGFPSINCEVAVVWGVGTLPGTTPDNPLVPVPTQDEPMVPPAPVAGSYLTFPVAGDYGRDGFVYVDPDYAAGYLYEADGSNFASFTVPNALPGGDDLFSLAFGGMTHTLQAGQAFNFTDYVIGGVSEFQLLGIDLSEQVDPSQLPPFVSGFKFIDDGVVTLTQTPLLAQAAAVPEPASLVIWGVGAIGLAIAARGRRKQTTG
jgi:hypothetical protein